MFFRLLPKYYNTLEHIGEPGMSKSHSRRIMDGKYPRWTTEGDVAELQPLRHHCCAGDITPPHCAALLRLAEEAAGSGHPGKLISG